MARLHHIQFRVTPEAFAQLEAAVAKAKKRGAAEATTYSYARVLFLLALGTPKDVVAANEVLISCHAARARIAKELGVLVEENIDSLLEAAFIGVEPDSGE